MLLAEDLLLLCVDDDSGRCVVAQDSMDRALAMALVFEMSIMGLVAPDAPAGWPREGDEPTHPGHPSRVPLPAKLGRVPGAHSSDALLSIAADTVDGRPLMDAVYALQQEQLRRAVTTRLVTRGVLKDDRLWSRGRHSQQDPQPEIALRARLRSVLLNGRVPTEHDVALIALIDHLQIVPGLFPHENAGSITRAAHDVAQRWDQTEPFQHSPGSGGGGRVGTSRFSGALDILDVIAAPLDLLDMF